ncbi:MAG: DUF1269 domain-containing protein [Geminicoccaceae bacterium]
MDLSLFAVAFSDGKAANDGRAALKRLHEEGTIRLVASAIAARDEDGELVVRESETPGATAAILGGVVGGLLGLLAGPFGAAMGVAAGAMSGGWFDLNRAEERERFNGNVAAKLKEGKTALLAEIAEPDAATKSLIREQMTSLGGSLV